MRNSLLIIQKERDKYKYEERQKIELKETN